MQILVGGRTEDKAVSLATLSGKLDLSNTRYVSASNFMIVKFSTDASVEKKGFRYELAHAWNRNWNYQFLLLLITFLLCRASWKTEPITCGGNLRATPQPQTLSSPGYPQNYPGGLECLYTISAQPGRIITLEVSSISLPFRVFHFQCYNQLEILLDQFTLITHHSLFLYSDWRHQSCLRTWFHTSQRWRSSKESSIGKSYWW